jgi:serine phosphatase RsbU (regulator of sigma subunit)/pSer/pThr/pTyr-binding forkhead associated (FHA) protein
VHALSFQSQFRNIDLILPWRRGQSKCGSRHPPGYCAVSVLRYNRGMVKLVITQGPHAAGRQFLLEQDCYVIGRIPEANIQLASQAVSRRHAQIFCEDETYFLEDLGSVNGTFLNGNRLKSDTPLADGDQLRIGDFVLTFHREAPAPEPEAIIRERVEVAASNPVLFAEKPEQKLQTILVLAQQLGQTLELQPLLDKLLNNLIQLFPLADRGLVVLCEGTRLVVRAQRSRRGDTDFSYSRTVIRKAIEEGRGLLTEDVHSDQRFTASSTLDTVETRSLLCVPLLGHDGKPLGALQLDCLQLGKAFTAEHLRLLTTMGLLAAVAVENVALNQVRVREEHLRRDLALGRDIQLGFLPTDFTVPPGSNYEIYAHIHPAKDVSGDLYDFFPLTDGRLAFLVGDVSDKGIPAAMFMVKVQTLVRHLALVTRGPSETLAQLDRALAVNNPSYMFVTLVHGIYDPGSGTVVLAAGGHPRPLLRKPDGKSNELTMQVGRLLGCMEGDPGAPDLHLILNRGETLILYSDGYTEATVPGTKKMFGLEALKELLGAQTQQPLAECGDKARQSVEQFIGAADLQDDLTLLLLRRL